MSRRGLCSIMLVLAGLITVGDSVAQAASSPVKRKIGAHMKVVVYNCGVAIGPEFAAVPGATSYEVTFWDGYYQQVIFKSITVDELKASAEVVRTHPLAGFPPAVSGLDKGSYYIGYTGSGGPNTTGAKCEMNPKDIPDPTEGGRFNKGAQAWAIIPEEKASLKVSIAAQAKGTKVGDTVGVKVTVTAGDVALTTVRLGSGLQVPTDLTTITSGPGAVAGFSLAAGASRTFTYTLKALKKGKATLKVSATGQSKKGSASDQASKQIEIISGTGVSGAVYGVSCGGKQGCTRSGLEGVKVLVTGQAKDGSPVAKTGVSAAGGAWFVEVPNGKYTVGPTLDGSKFAGPSFDPEKLAAVVNDNVADRKDFSVCASNTRSTSSAARSARSLASGPAFCSSIYTVTISAKLPAPVMVDPSRSARYNVSIDPNRAGYNPSTDWYGSYGHNPTVRHWLELAREYPGCLAPETVTFFDHQKAQFEWYSYYTGGLLGSVDIPVVWDAEHQRATTEKPVESVAKLTRVFKYRYTVNGKTVTNECTQTHRVPIAYLPVAGGDQLPGATDLPDGAFTVIVAWPIPFDPPGINLGEVPPGLLSWITKKGGETATELYEKFEKLNPGVKFGIEAILSYVTGEAVVGAVAKIGPAIDGFIGARAATMPWLAKIPALSRWLNLAAVGGHGFLAAREWVGFLMGSTAYTLDPAFGGYPLMSVVVRGQFTTKQSTLQSGANIYGPTLLGLSASSTSFPNITVKVTRDAFRRSDDRSVYKGTLPWKPDSSGVTTDNGLAPNNPPYLVSYDRSNGRSYDSGKQAMDRVIADTAQNPSVLDTWRHRLELVSAFGKEQAEARAPRCDPKFVQAPGKDTICWAVYDGRP